MKYAGSDILDTLPPGAVGGPVEAQVPALPFCGLALIGEAPGRDEVAQGSPFAGARGDKLDTLLARAGLERGACLVADVFRYRPTGNHIGSFFAADARARAEGLRTNPRLPPYRGGRCVAPHDEDVRTLWRLLRQFQPRAILAMGDTALWALSWQSGVARLAGQQLATRACDATVVATWHPAAFLRRESPDEEAAFLAHLRLAGRLAGALPAADPWSGGPAHAGPAPAGIVFANPPSSTGSISG